VPPERSLIRPMRLASLAEGYAILGQRAEGLNCLAPAAQFVETTEERVQEAELHRIRGGSVEQLFQ
jgi:hypothetical protein